MCSVSVSRCDELGRAAHLTTTDEAARHTQRSLGETVFVLFSCRLDTRRHVQNSRPRHLLSRFFN